MGRVLGGFRDQVVVQFTGKLLWRRTDGKWEYISAAAARDEAVFKAMEEYIRRRKNTVAQFIDTLSLLDLCEET